MAGGGGGDCHKTINPAPVAARNRVHLSAAQRHSPVIVIFGVGAARLAALLLWLQFLLEREVWTGTGGRQSPRAQHSSSALSMG